MRVLHEDAWLLAIDKPAGALTVRGREGAREPSLVDALAAQRGGRLYVVHRLDRETSGVLLLARTAEAHRRLNALFETGAVRKRYLALVSGAPAQEAFEVDAPLIEARRGKMRPANAGEQGKDSLTRFRVLERLGRFSLVEALPLTGRTHQIRVHLKYAGHPLALDPKYGRSEPLTRADLVPGGSDEPVLARTPLHALELSFTHPFTSAELALHAPLSQDIELALMLLRSRGPGPA